MIQILVDESVDPGIPVDSHRVMESRAMMLMEYCSRGELLSQITKQDGIHCLYQLKADFSQILRGVQAIHAAGFCNYDVKLENLLIGDDGKIKICDFGLAEKSDKDMVAPMGTAGYMAPEMYAGQQYKG